jgi:hypothetical protein
MQLPPPLKVPTPLLVKATVPVGVLAVPASVSLTVAVQVVVLLTGRLVGVQLTLVVVVRGVAVTLVMPELVAWVSSPP